MLHRLELSRRLSTWSIILSAYDIRYVPQNSMEAHALVDFMVEMTPIPEAPESTIEIWHIRTDGACGVGGSGIGIVMRG